MIIKKFVACIYLYHEHAVKSLNDLSVVETDPVRLAKFYCENNADELIVFDMSEGDAEHEAALDIMKEICTVAEVDVYGAGNINRMEDVKKILYTGCKKAILNYEKESNIAITEEVSLKFGKDKILLSYNDASILAINKDLIEKYISGLVLMNPHQIRETQTVTDLPFFVQINQITLNKLLEIFAYENVCGITGNTINENIKGILSIKELCKENNIPIWLTPALNIHRSPLCGRNFEYYSEDPFLTGKLAAAMVRGIQSQHISPSVKHFAFNNKETNRRNSDSRVSERAAREIYLKAFEIIVKEADPWCIMSSYNLVNGVRTSESRELLEDILRGEWGFRGVVTTDWWNYGEQYLEIKAGNDIKMGRGYAEVLLEALQSGAVSREEMEICGKRILELLLKFD